MFVGNACKMTKSPIGAACAVSMPLLTELGSATLTVSITSRPLGLKLPRPDMKFATTTLFFCVAALLALGMVMLFSASTQRPEANYLTMQPIWCGLGLLACLTTASWGLSLGKEIFVDSLDPIGHRRGVAGFGAGAGNSSQN